MNTIPPEFAKANILVVDDTPHNLHLLSATLTQQGFEVKGVINGLMALRVARSATPDLILLDITMPDMSGYEICQELKADPQTRDIPVIFLSALDDVIDKVKAFAVGGVDYITKPFQVEEVLVRINSQLTIQAAKAEIRQLNAQLEERVKQRTAQLETAYRKLEVAHQELQQEIQERHKASNRLKESEEKLESILNSLEDVVWSANAVTFELLYLNPAAQKVYDRKIAEFFNNPNLRLEVIHPEDRKRIEIQKAFKILLESGNLDLEYRIIRPNGEIRWLSDRSHVVKNEQGEAVRLDGIIYDITDQKIAQEKLIHDALHDSLTGLPNRILFLERVEMILKQTQRRSHYLFAVLFIDLDRFKTINDSLGHVAGDELLIQVASLLHGCLRGTDTVARLGGDEFTVLLDDFHAIEDVVTITERIQNKLSQPFNLGEHTVFTSASIGIVISSHKYQQAAELLRDADIAMYRAKELGKARYAIFDQNMYERTMKLSKLERDLRLALQHQQFSLHYQPIVSLATGQLTGFEALLRWYQPEQGFISPVDFIPIAEDTGLIVPIGEWVLYEACRQMRFWQIKYASAKSLKISVNLAIQQIKSASLLENLNRILIETGLDGNSLKLEITESMLMDDGDATIDLLSQIRAKRIQISIDDFGKGYSSLSYLHRFPINTIKIDRSFVSCMSSDRENFEIVRTIATLAHTLEMDLVAEGVETFEQLTQLKSLGCEFGQGYFFAKPLDSNAASTMLAEETQWQLSNQGTGSSSHV
jgi:diguanylate cyclase (GGDEF)-like protein/PAS domain S-box-containing protein